MQKSSENGSLRVFAFAVLAGMTVCDQAPGIGACGFFTVHKGTSLVVR